MNQPTATAPTEAPPSVTDRIERLSLEQALIDVEVANARTIDLTARLTEAHAEVAALRQQVQQARHVAGAMGATVPVASSLRSFVARPVKAVLRRVLPLEARTRIRQMVG